ncbi:hypothetical protein EBT31_17660, partial [bacterium]|nr:hypothetical protein [bacterium]
IPYGYGFGSLFAGSGVQMAAWGKGYQSIGDATTNIALIMGDNFLPIQPSRFNPFKPIGGYDRMQTATFWMLDTLAPTALKQPLEYAFGINGLGQQIGARSAGKYGAPYVANESSPEVFNDLTKWLSDVSDGGVTISPERLQFLVNAAVPITDEYVGKGYALYLTSKGELPFDIKNVPGAGVFTAKRRDPVPGKFYEAKYDVDQIISTMNANETRLEQGDKFALRRIEKFYAEHPEMEQYGGYDGFKKEWSQLSAELNKVQSEIKGIKGGAMGELTAGQRKQLVKDYEEQRDFIMEDMLDLYRTVLPKRAGN